MPKTIRESKMLEEVRRWRAEVYESVRRESAVTRLQRAQEFARRYNLPLLGEDDDGGADLGATVPPVKQARDR